MRCLLLSSVLLLWMGCAPAYKNLVSAEGSVNDLLKLKPLFSVALYKTNVDVKGNHLSGLLLIKRMPDSSTRLVFSNEMGFKFFDFEFDSSGKFKVYSIIPRLDKKAVITTLRKNFELILMDRLDSSAVIIRKEPGYRYYTFPQSKGFYHYVTNSNGDTLVRMERASKRKPVVQAIMKDYINGIPDTIGITHRNFDFTISLKRIER